MSSALLSLLLSLAATPEGLFTGAPRLSVLVTDTQFQSAPGVPLALCPLPDELPAGSFPLIGDRDVCLHQISDREGRAVFRDVPEAWYALNASLTGFADTTVGPLGIGRFSPVAPQEVILVLNPVCFDCVGPSA